MGNVITISPKLVYTLLSQPGTRAWLTGSAYPQYDYWINLNSNNLNAELVGDVTVALPTTLTGNLVVLSGHLRNYADDQVKYRWLHDHYRQCAIVVTGHELPPAIAALNLFKIIEVG